MAIIHLDSELPDPKMVEQVVDDLLNGEVIAYPTDTLMGLGCDATNPKAVARLCEIKGRAEGEPLPIIIHSRRMLTHLIQEPPHGAEALLNRHWPGGLTVVFRRRPAVLKAIPPAETLGLRIPDCIIALALARGLARPMVATSANRANQPPLTTAEEIDSEFGAQLAVVIHSDATPSGKPSTVVDLSGEVPKVLREGAIPSQQVLRYFSEG